jgi:CubicO group peptidase (beta-lactamase class C family)
VAENYQRLISYVEEIMELNHSSASSLVVIKENEIILEHYCGYHSNSISSTPVTETSKFNVASARKSYLGLAVAFALYENKIKSLDDYAIDYFDEYDKELLANTTIRHLVTHSHGLHQKDDGTLFREFDSGKGWAYRGINVLMMTELIKRLYGKSFPELLRKEYFYH